MNANIYGFPLTQKIMFLWNILLVLSHLPKKVDFNFNEINNLPMFLSSKNNYSPVAHYKSRFTLND